MNILPRKKLVEKTLKKVRDKYGIHNRPFTESDFYQICKDEKILLVNESSSHVRKIIKSTAGVKGFCAYSPKHNLHVIYLRCFFRKRFDIGTAMHELGHFFLGHTSVEAKFRSRKTRDKKYEPEADYFMELATRKSEVQNG